MNNILSSILPLIIDYIDDCQQLIASFNKNKYIKKLKNIHNSTIMFLKNIERIDEYLVTHYKPATNYIYLKIKKAERIKDILDLFVINKNVTYLGYSILQNMITTFKIDDNYIFLSQENLSGFKILSINKENIITSTPYRYEIKLTLSSASFYTSNLNLATNYFEIYINDNCGIFTVLYDDLLARSKMIHGYNKKFKISRCNDKIEFKNRYKMNSRIMTIFRTMRHNYSLDTLEIFLTDKYPAIFKFNSKWNGYSLVFAENSS